MLITSFFSWWYGRGWAQVIASIKPRIRAVSQGFSVAQLSRTLFDPWKKIITYPGASFQDKLRAWGDNLFSRIIGFVVRISVLFAAALSIVVIIILTVVEALAWPLLPASIIGLIAAGVIT